MDSTVLAVIVVAVVAVIIIGLIVAMSRRTRLRHLSDESKVRYATSWRAIQTRFVEDPAGAVGEADQLAVSILRDRGASLDDVKHMPDSLRSAREAAQTGDGVSQTEGLRSAMLHYQNIVDDAVGETMRKAPETTRREIA
jgi:hypothetical protein